MEVGESHHVQLEVSVEWLWRVLRDARFLDKF